MEPPNVVNLPAPHGRRCGTMAVTASSEPTHSGARSCAVCGSMLLDEHVEETVSGQRCIFCGAEMASATRDGSTPTVPGDVGITLREARLARRETLVDASRWTCVRTRYLVALEGNHPVDEFPGRIYARFFLKEYAEHLELDPEPLLRSFDRAGNAAAVSDLEPMLVPPRHRPRWGLAAIVSCMFLIAIAALSIMRSSNEAPAGVLGAGATDVPSAPAYAGEPRSATSPTPLHAMLTMRAACWIEATVDGRGRPAKTYPPGSTLVYRARHALQLWLGNAGGVSLSVNGRRVTTGSSGQPVQLSFTWRDGAVHEA